MMVPTNSIESIWAVLKRGFTDVYHSWSMKHCNRYVDEFTFRLNEGNCKIDTFDRMVVLSKVMENKWLKYKELIR